MGPKHKPAEWCAIFDPVTKELITDKNEILSTTLKCNIGVLTENKIGGSRENILHGKIMNDTTKGETDSWIRLTNEHIQGVH